MSRALLDPRVVCGAAAIALRGAIGLQASARPEASSLDAGWYLGWAADIASGDVLGSAGVIHGEPFLFNPLYAYVLAPLVALFGASPAPVVVFQALLAGATTALAAAAARRFAGLGAAWIAGLAVAFSTALVHLDGQVAVSGLAAFLVAGATWALSPGDALERHRRGHGPVAAGVWLGLATLARPIVLPAVLCAAWLHGRRSHRPWRAAALVALPVAVCAALSFARNFAVSGEAVVYTAANGQNLHLGNNPVARRTRAMATDAFDFGPVAMHDDARYRVAYEIGHEPTRSEISAWFTRRAAADLAAAPGESVAWYVTKLRWFAGPAELGSSAEIDRDRAAFPLLGAAFVPTWILVAMAAASLVVATRRADLLLGPGALVASHAAACALVYPLSHYRSPAIPALAVMSGVAVAGMFAAWRAGQQRRALAALGVAAVVAIAGALPPQAIHFPEAEITAAAVDALERGDLAAADDLARRALATGDDTQALTVHLVVAVREGRFADARAVAARLLELRPWDPDARIDVAWNDLRLGRTADGLREIEDAVALYPWSGKVISARGGMRVLTGDVAGGREDLLVALRRGFTPPGWALEKAGLTPSSR